MSQKKGRPLKVEESKCENWTKTCPMCQKSFTVLYPEIYAYKGKLKNKSGNYNNAYFCSWSCLQASRRDETLREKRRIQKEFLEAMIHHAADEEDAKKPILSAFGERY